MNRQSTRLGSSGRGLTAAKAVRLLAKCFCDRGRDLKRCRSAASAHPADRRASFGFENEAVALAKIDAHTEDRALLAGFAHDPLEDVAIAFRGRGGGIGRRQARDRKDPSGRALCWPPSWPCQRLMNTSTTSATHDFFHCYKGVIARNLAPEASDCRTLRKELFSPFACSLAKPPVRGV